MVKHVVEKNNCTGCSACMTMCPVQCISMIPDDEGFLYPVASDACIHCGRCIKVCPLQNGTKTNEDVEQDRQDAFCAISKDISIWRRSASGGAFSELCRAFGDKDTVFCGAAWDGLYVHHVCVKGFDAIKNLCKSKYVSSNPENVFAEIKQFLNEGKKVVFCGTPCQVAGLKKVVGKDDSNILYIDLICHGVGSPKVFETCMKQIGDQLGGQVTSYEFRAKRNAFERDHLQKINIKNGKQFFLSNDPYIQLFLSQSCLRPSCGKNCKFRSEHRQGDVTIADFKGLTSVFPDLVGTKRNYSTIVIHSDKAYNLLPALRDRMELRSCSIDDIKKYNPLYCRQTWFSDNRDLFFKDFIENPDNAVEQYTKSSAVSKLSLKKMVWMSLPQTVRSLVIRKIIRGGVMQEYETCSISKVIIKKTTADGGD